MSRRFSLQIILPIEGYEEDKIYKNEEIALTSVNLNKKPDDVYYRCLKEKSIYTSSKDIVEFASQKYSLGEMHDYSIHTDWLGDYEIIYEGNKYIVTAEEAKLLEKEYIFESIYCNVFKDCRLSRFYTSIGDELLPDDMAIVDDELIQKASALVGYESKIDFAKGLADVIEYEADGEDMFIASLILAKEIASCINGRAILWYD